MAKRKVSRRTRRQTTRSERSLWSRRPPEPAVSDALVGANVDPEKAEAALEALQATVRDVAVSETQTERYARCVLAVCECIKLGIATQRIAEVIVKSQPGFKESDEPNPAYRGAAARYVFLARIELKRYRPGEHHVDDHHKVSIKGQPFYSPVKALNANIASYRQVFMAFLEAVKPETRVEIPDKLSEAVQGAIEHLTFKLRKGRKIEKVRVKDNPEALIELLRAILAHPLMEGMMSPASRRGLKTRLEAKAQELASA